MNAAGRSIDAADPARIASELRRLLMRDDRTGGWTEQVVYEGLIRLLPLLGATELRRLLPQVTAHLTGVGPLFELLGQPGVSDVLINGPGHIWVERHGVLERTNLVLDGTEIDRLIDRLVTPSGGRVDPASPIADARLADGTRVCAVGRAIAPNGPVVALRRFVERQLPLESFGTTELCALLTSVIRSYLNVVVFGGTGAGKTSVLNALGASLEADERVVTIEDTAELRLPNANLVSLEARSANAEGVGEVTISHLLRTALRLRPDRIVVGEVRGAEAADLLAALSTGHRGGLSTVHAGNPVEALDRLEEMVLSGEGHQPSGRLLRDRLHRTVDVLVGVGRGPHGGRQIFGVWEPVVGRSECRPLWTPGSPPQAPSRDRVCAAGQVVVGHGVVGQGVAVQGVAVQGVAAQGCARVEP